MKITAALAFASAHGVLAAADPGLQRRQTGGSCPGVHVFGARETTVSPGFGSSETVVDLITQAYSGATAKAIEYPACGGQSSCGGIAYADSAAQGAAAVVEAVTAFASECPSTQIVLVGYSQGGQIMDDALCGGDGAAALTGPALASVKAAIFLGNPHFSAGQSFEVGTCEAGGFAARPEGFTCASADRIQSYCDAADPYCCNGNDQATHQGYGAEYGQEALAFVQSQLNATSSAAKCR